MLGSSESSSISDALVFFHGPTSSSSSVMMTLHLVLDASVPLMVSASFNFAVGLWMWAESVLMLLVEPPTASPFAGP